MKQLRRSGVVLLPSLAIGIYLIGYLVLCPRYLVMHMDLSARIIRHEWERALWSPVLRLEQACRGKNRFYWTVVDADTVNRKPEVGLIRVWP